MGTTKLSENVEVFDLGSVINGNSLVGNSLVGEKVECLDSLMSDVNGSESMVVEEQCDGKKRKRKKEKRKALKKDLSAEISSVNNESSGMNGGSAMGTSLVDEKVECLNISIRDDNGSEPMVVEEQCDDKKVSGVHLKHKKKKDKGKALNKDLSADISSVNNESSSLGAFIPEKDSKVLVEDAGMISSSCVDVEPIGNKALVKPIEEGNILRSLSLSIERHVIQRSRKKLLILDVNGLLADLVPYVPDGLTPDTVISRKSVFKRPYCDDFLKFCFDRFNVGIWSSRTRKNVEMVVDFLMRDSKHKLLFCWDQFHCTKTGFTTVENREKPLVLKELKKLWKNIDHSLPWKKGEYDESNTLLLDDSPYKALCNPAHTGIFPYSYHYTDHCNSSLGPGGDLRMYLERLADAENVQKFVAENPYGQRAITESNASWGFYRKIINIVSSQSRCRW